MLNLAVFSSSDEEEEFTVAEINLLRRLIRQNSDIFSMPNSKLSKPAFKYVLDKISPQLEEAKRSTSVPN
ncbi:hypothetical protein DOY81_010349, partial [Sarcophaga bullata]